MRETGNSTKVGTVGDRAGISISKESIMSRRLLVELDPREVGTKSTH